MSEQIVKNEELEEEKEVATEESKEEIPEIEVKPLTMKEKVRKDIEEETERAKRMSDVIRKRDKKEVKPKEDFFNYIYDAQKELNEGLDFLKRAEKEPKIVFTLSAIHLKSTRGMIYSIMNHWKNPNEAIKGHDFQAYVADVANRYFQEWLQSKGITEPFHLEVRIANQFPSIFAIYHENRELLQCDVLKQWYGVRKRAVTEEKVMERYEKELIRIDGEIEEQKQDIEKAIMRRDEPLKFYKGLKNRLQYFFIDKKKLYERFDTLVNREKSALARLEQEKERIIQYHPINIQENNERRALIEQVEPFFLELGYTENTNQSSLY